ncbi:phage tail protein [Salmonella enterica subsp. enterica serovar Edinburgh]|nr:phage tail protein [Salmonella enterica subsp. enterica serovar Edinburgh]EBH8901395.1 phage tail protein [Salmonella enterica subsp. enterica serovar 6,7:b:-]EBH8906254.1 phage tail protein [Salmonella enterica subsp. enterica serovar Santiago]EBH8945425.1 phage tail protein [Salmonella enterica subsp. enterica serovar 6,7:b:-]EBH8966264.1 phage tail protein [Salmonella enterica subsp. enterica serovar Santiago]
MHRIDTKTAQKDKFGAGKNGFTRGNPQTGTPATDLDDDYFDMLQEELCSVVEASGASLEKGRHDQLLTALRALLLSRKNPFGDIKSDGTVKTALENLGLKETLNPTKRVSIGNIGTGAFDGSTPSINIGDSDSGFIGSADGVLDIYCNNAKVGYIDNAGLHMLADILSTGAIRAGGSKKLAIQSDNNSTLSAIFNLRGDANRPTVIELNDDQGWHLYSQRNIDGSIRFTVNGDVTAGRALHAGNATFAADGNVNGSVWGGWLNDWINNNFNRKNTAGLGSFGWVRDESTGFIMQWGTLGGSNGTYNFPRAFPAACFAVFVTNTSSQGALVDNAFGYPVNNSQFFAATKASNGAGTGAYPVAWFAIGR